MLDEISRFVCSSNWNEFVWISILHLNKFQAYTYWLNDMYMDIRIPTPINSNPGMVLPPRNFHTVNDVARFAAQVITRWVTNDIRLIEYFTVLVSYDFLSPPELWSIKKTSIGMYYIRNEWNLNLYSNALINFILIELNLQNEMQWTVAKRACRKSWKESTTVYGSTRSAVGLLPSSWRSTWQSIPARASKWSACYRFLPKSGKAIISRCNYLCSLPHNFLLLWKKNIHFGSAQMYVIPVKAGDRGRLSEKEIESQLLFILSDAPCVTVKPPPIGLLTGNI